MSRNSHTRAGLRAFHWCNASAAVNASCTPLAWCVNVSSLPNVISGNDLAPRADSSLKVRHA